MRKSPYFAMSLLLTALGAQAADLPGTTTSPIGVSSSTSRSTSGSTSTPASNTGVNAQTGVNASATSRDAPVDTTLPVAPPLQSSAPTETPSTTPVSTTASGSGGTANGTSTPRMRSNAGTTSTTSTTTGTVPDNTRINQRDRNKQTLTPGDQANTSEDISITSSIRQALVKSDLSIIARNIKIITSNGRVTLRGPVKTEAEKARIESVARTAAGATTVDNQLDVKATTY